MIEQDFLTAIASEPKDPTPRLVYADWLDEQGDLRGELIRLQEELRRIEVSHRAAKETRMRELLKAGVEPLSISKTNSLKMKFVLIFPGEFLMGSPPQESGRHPNEHQHPVQITEPFYLCCYQLTQRDYFWIHDDNHDELSVELSGVGSRRPLPFLLSWLDAVRISNRLSEMEGRTPSYTNQGKWRQAGGYRLPTEAEWEYACRAGTTTATPYGETLTRNDANFLGSRRRKGPQVGIHAPNGFGLYDMIGNAWEWCSDWLDDDYYRHSPEGNPPGPKRGIYRVARGGGLQSNRQSCRSAFRNRLTPTNNTDACLRLVLPSTAK